MEKGKQNGERLIHSFVGNETVEDNLFGLTKREYFAGLALQGLLATPVTGDVKEFAKSAVKVADALLKELAK